MHRHKDDRILQLFGKLSGTLLIALDQLHAVVFLRAVRETRADVAAADQHNALVGFLQTLEFAHYRANMLRCGDKEDFVASFNDG